MKILLLPEGLYPIICNNMNDAIERISIYRQNNSAMQALYAELESVQSGRQLNIIELKFKSI